MIPKKSVRKRVRRWTSLGWNLSTVQMMGAATYMVFEAEVEGFTVEVSIRRQHRYATELNKSVRHRVESYNYARCPDLRRNMYLRRPCSPEEAYQAIVDALATAYI